ncbi:hypothetical protein ACHQM5_019719 [Ranunculus cassubicifolius]
MGDSSKEEEAIGSYNFYNPCYYLEMAAKGFLKCLGIEAMEIQIQSLEAMEILRSETIS